MTDRPAAALPLAERARHHVYATLAETGAPPDAAALAAALGLDEDAALQLLGELDAAHLLVLDPGDRRRIRMALPFSGIPTAYRVEARHGGWWANCAWDAIAIVRLLGLAAAEIVDHGDAHRRGRTLHVVDGDLRERDGLVHFAVPAARWWDDIVFT